MRKALGHLLAEGIDLTLHQRQDRVGAFLGLLRNQPDHAEQKEGAEDEDDGHHDGSILPRNVPPPTDNKRRPKDRLQDGPADHDGLNGSRL